jgi:hypothetical protein
MYHHYLKPALRLIVKARLYSLTNILSLAVGLSTCLLIHSFVHYESSFDSMHPDSERLYRLNWQVPEAGSRFATFFNRMTPILAELLPEIEAFSRLAIRWHVLSVDGVDQFAELSMVDDDFFDLFAYPNVAGAAATAIRDMDSAVLTEAAATRLFGVTDAVGRVFTVDDAHDFRVASVVINNQVDYAYDKPLGFDASDVVKVELPNAAARRALDAMRNQLLGLSDVVSVSAGSIVPTLSLSDGTGLVGEGVDPDNPLVVRSVSVGEDFFATLGMQFVAGRPLSRDFPTDLKPPLSTERPVARGSIVLNESAARLAG